MRRFEYLLAPGRLGSLEIRNRIVMCPMGSNLAEPNGHVGERLARYYEARAAGGVGLIIVGVGAIAYPAGACLPNQVAISDDCFLPGLRDLTDRLHARGTKVAIQLQHSGKLATQDMAAGRPLRVPSIGTPKLGDLFTDLTPEEIGRITAYLTKPGAGVDFRELTFGDIHELVEQFADAADRARRAGFDGVEIHAAHGYLISSFLSPATNQRQDRYGGPLENRARLLVEVIRGVRRRVGERFPVWCRLDAKEFRTENGITLEDARRTAELAEAAGVDAIHVSAYADPMSGIGFTEAPLVHEPCGYVVLAEEIKRHVRVPVIAVGRIEPEQADRLLKAGRADFVGMGRKLLADPELPNKLAESRPEDIRPCIYCYTCVSQIYLNEPLRCTVNPGTGREAEFAIERSREPRRVLVAGGGPAGMEAARVAALRGHHVILCEQEPHLGGTLVLASLVYEANSALLRYLEAQLRKLPIDLRLGQRVTRALVRELRPDVVLVAVGAGRDAPSIPGADAAHVLSGDDLRSLVLGGARPAGKFSPGQRAIFGLAELLGVTRRPCIARAISKRWLPLGKRIAVIGGGLVGVELAEFLSKRGREVTILEESETLAVEMALPRRWRALYGLRQRGVSLITGARVERITDEAVDYTVAQGARRELSADSVIVAAGARPDRALFEDLADLGAEIHPLGDCGGLGYIEGAVLDGARVARSI